MPSFKSMLTACSLLIGAALFTPSCADNNSSLFIVGVMDLAQASCIAMPQNTGPFLAAGTLDTAFASGYTAVLLVGNQMTQQGSMEQLRTETSRVTLRGAEVDLTTLDGHAIDVPGAQSTFSTVGTGFVDPAAGTAPSYATVAVNVIPPGLSNLPPQVLAKIRVFGETLGGTSITSSELDFPITVCDGCLVVYDTPDATQAAGAPFMCATAAASSTQTTTAAPCITGQDQTFSCTLCSAAYALCRDPCQNPTFSSSTNCAPTP
ncbi:MAG TPA: hypothetical protein VGM44_08400 [Polyangiaceae bacterium]|jgi:hypothetical protein